MALLALSLLLFPDVSACTFFFSHGITVTPPNLASLAWISLLCIRHSTWTSPLSSTTQRELFHLPVVAGMLGGTLAMACPGSCSLFISHPLKKCHSPLQALQNAISKLSFLAALQVHVYRALLSPLLALGSLLLRLVPNWQRYLEACVCAWCVFPWCLLFHSTNRLLFLSSSLDIFCSWGDAFVQIVKSLKLSGPELLFQGFTNGSYLILTPDTGQWSWQQPPYLL